MPSVAFSPVSQQALPQFGRGGKRRWLALPAAALLALGASACGASGDDGGGSSSSSSSSGTSPAHVSYFSSGCAQGADEILDRFDAQGQGVVIKGRCYTGDDEFILDKVVTVSDKPGPVKEGTEAGETPSTDGVSSGDHYSYFSDGCAEGAATVTKAFTDRGRSVRVNGRCYTGDDEFIVDDVTVSNTPEMPPAAAK